MFELTHLTPGGGRRLVGLFPTAELAWGVAARLHLFGAAVRRR